MAPIGADDGGRTAADGLFSTMKGAHKFSPQSGAELSRERLYPGTIPMREAVDGSGELTNGELVSNGSRALLGRFRDLQERHRDEEDAALTRAAAAAIQKLRKQDPWDCWLWYALAEHLDRRDDVDADVEWMLGHVDPRCPFCTSRTKIEHSVTGYPNVKCAAHCRHRNDVTVAVVDQILELYNASFEEPIDEVGLLDPR